MDVFVARCRSRLRVHRGWVRTFSQKVSPKFGHRARKLSSAVISGFSRIFAYFAPGVKNTGKNAKNGRPRVSRHPGDHRGGHRSLTAIAPVQDWAESPFEGPAECVPKKGRFVACLTGDGNGTGSCSSAAPAWLARGGAPESRTLGMRQNCQRSVALTCVTRQSARSLTRTAGLRSGPIATLSRRDRSQTRRRRRPKPPRQPRSSIPTP